jgi:DNA protecting protein DprA
MNDLIQITQQNFWPPELWPATLWIEYQQESALDLLKLCPHYSFAVVGTRHPQLRLYRLIKECFHAIQHQNTLNSSPLVIVSGLAIGIDTWAHELAIEHHLPTVAFVAHGLDSTYPEEQCSLRSKILQAGGLVISEFEPGTKAKPDYFLQRNRLIAAFSQSTWVVQASYRSGALNTARWTRDQSKITYSTPCFPGDSTLAGNQILLDRDHAIPYYGPQSLGHTWDWMREYNERTQRQKLKTSQQTIKHSGQDTTQDTTKDEALLINILTDHTESQNGITREQLYNLAMAKNCSSDSFFQSLQLLISRCQVIDEQGRLLINRENTF